MAGAAGAAAPGADFYLAGPQHWLQNQTGYGETLRRFYAAHRRHAV